EFLAGEGACQGDSGGGLYDQKSIDDGKPLVVGTVSRGPVDQETGKCGVGVYERVDKFADFIIAAGQAAAKDGGYQAPEWAGGGPAPQTKEPPKEEPKPEAEVAPEEPPPPVTKTTTTTTTGCSASRAPLSGVNDGFVVVALGALGAVFARRR